MMLHAPPPFMNSQSLVLLLPNQEDYQPTMLFQPGHVHSSFFFNDRYYIKCLRIMFVGISLYLTSLAIRIYVFI